MNPVKTDLAERITVQETAQHRTLWYQAGVFLILIGFVYSDVLVRMVTDWWVDPNFSHGFLVPLFSAFVVWQRRRSLASLSVNPSWFGLVIIAGALSVLIVGVLGAEVFLQRSSLVFLLAGLVIYFLGWRHFRAVLFPWAFLFFMIPIPAIVFNQIAFPLQFLAARFASFLLAFVGVPVLREGNILRLPSMSMEVAQACSGIRSLMTLGALAVIYGYFLEPRTLRRVLLALASVPIAVLANGIRVMGTGLLGHFWSPDKAEGFFHTFSGWIIFILSLAMLMLVQRAVSWWDPHRAQTIAKEVETDK